MIITMYFFYLVIRSLLNTKKKKKSNGKNFRHYFRLMGEILLGYVLHKQSWRASQIEPSTGRHMPLHGAPLVNRWEG